MPVFAGQEKGGGTPLSLSVDCHPRGFQKQVEHLHVAAGAGRMQGGEIADQLGLSLQYTGVAQEHPGNLNMPLETGDQQGGEPSLHKEGGFDIRGFQEGLDHPGMVFKASHVQGRSAGRVGGGQIDPRIDHKEPHNVHVAVAASGKEGGAPAPGNLEPWVPQEGLGDRKKPAIAGQVKQGF